ncbi:hypothetical protein AKJ16_DCAP02033 [Drosera capensis]
MKQVRDVFESASVSLYLCGQDYDLMVLNLDNKTLLGICTYAITYDFRKPYRFLFEAHVINFFKDQLWQAVNQEWLECLCNAPVEHILQIPSGFVLDDWPASLKGFILTSRSLVFLREQVKLTEILPDTHVSPLSCVLSQVKERLVVLQGQWVTICTAYKKAAYFD